MDHSLEDVFEASVQDGTMPGVVLLAKNSSGMTLYCSFGRLATQLILTSIRESDIRTLRQLPLLESIRETLFEGRT